MYSQHYSGGYSNVEVIVINDGSIDLTEAKIKGLALTDSRIRLFSQKNSGVAAARNTGLCNATGRYIAWCDADDWYEPDFLETMLSYLKKYDADISVCRAKIVGQDRQFDSEKVWLWDRDEAIETFLEHKLLNGVLWEKMFKKELFEGVSFDESLKYFEDLEVVWKILKRVNRVVRFEQEKYNFYIHPESLCAQKFSEERAYCSFKVWNAIVDECVESEKNIDSAKKRRYIWLFGDLKMMLQVDYTKKEDIRTIQSMMRQESHSGLNHLQGFNKLYAVICIFSIPMARTLIRMIKR